MRIQRGCFLGEGDRQVQTQADCRPCDQHKVCLGHPAQLRAQLCTTRTTAGLAIHSEHLMV